MNILNIIIGILMLASAAVFVYFEDPLIVRIISAAIFIVGAVLLYSNLSKLAPEEDTEAEEDGVKEPDSPARTHQTAETPDAPAARPATRPAVTPPMSTAADEAREFDEAIYKPAIDTEMLKDPRSEFDYLTNRVLQVMKDVLLANTAAMFWINTDRGQIICGEHASDNRSFTTARRFPLGSDFISSIGLSGRPSIIAEIRQGSEADMLKFYDSPEGIRSCIGVPMYFDDEIIGVLVADSRAQDAFGSETVETVGRFSSIILLLLHSYNRKFELTLDSRLLGVLDSLNKTITLHSDHYGIASAVARSVTEALDWDFTAVVLYQPQDQKWRVIKSMTRTQGMGYVAEGVVVDIEGSVFRSVIERNEGLLMDAPMPPQFRFHDKEAIPGGGQVIAMPLSTPGRVYGLVVVEYRENHQYGVNDTRTMARLASHASLALENEHLNTVARRQLMTDESTQTGSRAVFVTRVTEEIERMQDQGGTAFFFLVSCDSADEIARQHDASAVETAMMRIAQTVKLGVRGYEAVGRLDARTFGLLLIDTTSENAFLRAEKMRAQIASTVLTQQEYSFSIASSFAGCPVTADMDFEHLHHIARQLLDRAISDGGNCVRVA